jgi:hypothetical protein
MKKMTQTYLTLLATMTLTLNMGCEKQDAVKASTGPDKPPASPMDPKTTSS